MQPTDGRASTVAPRAATLHRRPLIAICKPADNKPSPPSAHARVTTSCSAPTSHARPPLTAQARCRDHGRAAAVPSPSKVAPSCSNVGARPSNRRSTHLNRVPPRTGARGREWVTHHQHSAGEAGVRQLGQMSCAGLQAYGTRASRPGSVSVQSISDVVYATSMLGRAVLGATLQEDVRSSRSFVADEAYERARTVGPLRRATWTPSSASAAGCGCGLLREGARPRAPSRESPRLPERLTSPHLAVDWEVPRERVAVSTNARATAPFASRSRRGSCRARGRRADARVRRAGHQAEVSRGGWLGVGGPGGRTSRSSSPATGPIPAEVRRRVLELGLDGRVRFLGSLGRNDVLTLFRAADAWLPARRRRRTSAHGR